MRGDLHSTQMMTEAKTTITAPGIPGTYGLGLMKKTFLGLQAYGHGGDLSYSASSWYFPDRDISISVLNNDSRNNSWTLVPVVTALLKTYNDWLPTSNINESASENIQVNVFPNPFTDHITLSLNSNQIYKHLKCEIVNLLGEKISVTELSNVLSSDQTIQFKNLADLPTGIYILNILSEEGVLKSIKLVK